MLVDAKVKPYLLDVGEGLPLLGEDDLDQVARSATMQSTKLPVWNLKEPLTVSSMKPTTTITEGPLLLPLLKPCAEAGLFLGYRSGSRRVW